MVPLLTSDQAALLLGISKVSLQRLRANGSGPKYIVLGKRRIGYRRSDLLDWLDSQTVGSTDEARSLVARVRP